jgi:predicted glycosyltransferase
LPGQERERMNILIDIGHPAHVHLFRNAARIWMERGHKVVVAIRDRDIVADLLNAYRLEFTVASKARTSFLGLVWELVEHDYQVLRLAVKHRSHVLVGTSVAVSHVSRVTKARSIVFNEDDADVARGFAWLSYPFAHAIVTPEGLRDRGTAKRVTHNSYHELAYLHPNQFQPDPNILTGLGVQPGELFFVVRLVALKAYHDVGHAGLSLDAQRRLIERLSQRGRVFITVEGDLPEGFRPYQMPIPPHQIHHALHYAAMLISDSQTMTIEAAVLGTPAIRCNTFVGRCSVIEELEHKYGLTYGFLPVHEERMFRRIDELLDDPGLHGKWQRKRERMLADKIDLTAWMVDYVENYGQRDGQKAD